MNRRTIMTWGAALLVAGGIGWQAGPGFRATAAGKAAAAEADGAEDAKPTAYPVLSVAPVARTFRLRIHGIGAIQADPRRARTVSMTTAGAVRSVDVVLGERVAAGQALFSVEPDPLAYLAYRQAESAARLARAELERLRAQRADHLATQGQVEAEEKALADAEAALDAARRQGAAGGVQQLTAPVAGVVTLVGAGSGDRPAPGTVLATIAPEGAATGVLGVEPGEARQVHAGDRVAVRVIDAPGATRLGRVTLVGAALDRATRLVPVIVALDAPGFGDAPVGSAIEGEIEARGVEAFSVPRGAIVKDEAGTAVFEIAAGKAHRVPVVVEADEGTHLGVSGALSPSRPVVTTGAYELEDGAAVAERKP